MEETRNQKRCQRCLFSEFDKEGYLKKLYGYVKNLDEDIKASADVYGNRLSTCKDCTLLAEGLCRACGCFVELRAAIRNNVCPYDKWR